jgi:hypothetical protein
MPILETAMAWMVRQVGILVGALCVVAGQPLEAKAPKESFCTLIRKTEDGRFRTDRLLTWSLYAAQREPGEIAYDSDVVGVTCLRDPVTLVAEDAETLRLGITIYLADPRTQTTVTYKREGDRIVHQVTAGALSEGQLSKVAKSATDVAAGL